MGHSSPEVHSFFPRQLSLRQTLESAYAETPRSRPRLTVTADERINACLRWFKQELNPQLGSSGEAIIKGQRDSAKVPYNVGNKSYRSWKADHDTYWYKIRNDLSDAVEWADEMRFGQMTFSAQRVALFLRAIVAQPDVVILDEAFSGMDDFVREKCLLFLEHGEARRHELNAAEIMQRGGLPGHYVERNTFSIERKGSFAIPEGLTANQALIVVSHVQEELPKDLTHWLFLPKVGQSDSCKSGRVSPGALKTDSGIWSQIWSAHE